MNFFEQCDNILNEAKTMSKEVAVEIMKILSSSVVKDGQIYFSAFDRDELKAALPKGTRLTRDVPKPTSGQTLGHILKAAGVSGDCYFDNGDFVQGDKTVIKSAVGSSTYGEIASAVGIKF
jgi:hypothetical protein